MRGEVVVGGGVVKPPPRAIERIRRYRIACYEDTAGIGKR